MTGIVRTPWTRQPPVPAQIDWSNPLTRGLVLVLDPGTGLNLVTNKLFTRTGTKQVVTRNGIVRGFGSTLGAGASDYIPTTTSTNAAAGGAVSVAFSAFVNGISGNSLTGRIFNNGSGVQDTIYANSSTGVFQYTRNNTTSNLANCTWSFTAGAPHHHLVTQSGGVGVNAVVYVDGVAVTVTAGSATTANATASDTWNIGNRPTGDRNLDGWIGYFYVWHDRILTAAEAASLSANPWQIFAPLPRRIWAPAASGGDVTITASAGDAVANGSTAAVVKTLPATPGDAVADGSTAAVTRGISATPGTAAADGSLANVLRTIVTTPGTAAADGSAASVIRGIAASPGNAVANGVTATINTAAVITATPGNAVADGISATIAASTTVSATPGNAVADGVTASVAQGVVVSATPGNAVADGTTAGLTRAIPATPGNAAATGPTANVLRTIGAAPGNAVANGVTATISTSGVVSISATPGNAAASGALAAIVRTIAASPGNAVANGSIAALLRTIAASPGNAVADGVGATVIASATVSAITGNAVANGITAAILFPGSTPLIEGRRTLYVPQDNRELSVLVEARSLAVPAETRTVYSMA